MNPRDFRFPDTAQRVPHIAIPTKKYRFILEYRIPPKKYRHIEIPAKKYRYNGLPGFRALLHWPSGLGDDM